MTALSRCTCEIEVTSEWFCPCTYSTQRKAATLVRAGANVGAYDREDLEQNETLCPALATDEHWLACKDLILGVRAAGSWRAYARLPRKRVLRLRSLMLRGRTKPRRTGAPNVVARTFKLPNEMVWKVLAFWRVESEVTGEVI